QERGQVIDREGQLVTVGAARVRGGHQPGIVDQHVETRQERVQVLRQTPHLRELREIRLHEAYLGVTGVTADVPGHRASAGEVTSVDQDSRAARGQCPRGRASDAVRGPGDNANPAIHTVKDALDGRYM